MHVLDAGALLGMVSSCYVALYGQARILCVVARDHMLPPVLARISPQLGTPAIAATVIGLATGMLLPDPKE
jgi:basic amino acid/polyamine antiporter, APA family